MNRRLVMTAACIALGACALRPDGKPPAMPQPAHYGAQPQAQASVTAEGASQRFVAGAPPVPA